ncbi:MAG: UDP-2,4-diacetamido-2,4,6-trideoxy-beta-L-altropyranose hydrolase, partial [Bacteroidota bacterium]
MTDSSATHRCLILADANPQIGTGHVMRCAILGRHLRERGIAVDYVVADTTAGMQAWIRREGFGLHVLSHTQRDDAEQLHRYLQQLGSQRSLLLFDSDREAFYRADYQRKLRDYGLGLLMITFHNAEAFYVHLLHNQNPLALDTVYHCPLATRQLLGLEYVILKPAYEALYEASRTKSTARISTILLTFGGSDQWNLTATVLGLLDRLASPVPLRIIAVVGALYRGLDALKKQVAASQHQAELYVQTEEMPRLMYEADLAITSGGLTVWELACCKTLNLVLPTSIREIRTAAKL